MASDCGRPSTMHMKTASSKRFGTRQSALTQGRFNGGSALVAAPADAIECAHGHVLHQDLPGVGGVVRQSELLTIALQAAFGRLGGAGEIIGDELCGRRRSRWV